MSLPYKRNFKIGRQSEQFLNDKFHLIYEALKEINYRKNENKGEEPDSKVDGALWFDKIDNILKYYDMRSLSWKTVFNEKFQITDQILNLTMPSSPVIGQLWICNGVLMYFDGSSWKPIKAMLQDESQWSTAVFEDFMIVTPLNPMPNAVVDGESTDIDLSKFTDKLDDNHYNTNVIQPKSVKWGTDEWDNAEIKEPTVNKVPADNLKSQFVIPNLNTDRIFVDKLFDTNYQEVSKVCIQYPTKDVYNKAVSCIHLNPGKVSKITKRFIKIDKLNSTINISAYNTEFYGFKKGKIGGDFLIESNNQDSGDYIPSGDYIVLNYNANQNYDYILAITYEFSSLRATGSMDHWNNENPKTSFYLSNLKEPINVHANGLKLEEASYDIDYQNKTVTINDEDADLVDIQMWSPYRKQFGYIRETDLEGNGIIRLRKRVSLPLVFVGGTLIHPLFGGIKVKGDIITIPNHSGLDTMKNLAWCVVDLLSDKNEVMYSERGEVVYEEPVFIMGKEDYLTNNKEDFIVHGDMGDIDPDGFRDYILASGNLISSANGGIIRYDNRTIKKDDGIILFIDGFMINNDDIIRNHEEGFITIKPELAIGQQYVLLRDNDKRLYANTMLQAAYATGYLDESLVYYNGQLLLDSNCLSTIYNESTEIGNGVVDNEIKYFIESDDKKGIWKIYNEYNYEWDVIDEEETPFIELIASSYSNQLTSIKLNIEVKENDTLDVYSFKYSNSISGIYKYGEAVFLNIDEEDGLQIWKTGNDPFACKQGVLNLYKNGIKLISGLDFKELSENNYIKMLNPDIKKTDFITYIIEPIEAGETYGHETILLSREDSINTNIYSIGNDDSVPDLYPGRLTVYINGLRLPKENWILLDNKRIMLKYNDYKALGSDGNYPNDTIVKPSGVVNITHNYPDYILIEIRKDYDRQERTFELKEEDAMEIYLDKYNIPLDILSSKDEVLFYLNGQFLNLSRSRYKDYKLDSYKGCIAITNSEIIQAFKGDLLKQLFDRNSLAYASWKARNNNKKYESTKKNILTIVWR